MGAASWRHARKLSAVASSLDQGVYPLLADADDLTGKAPDVALEKFDDLLELLLGLVDPGDDLGHVRNGVRHAASGSVFAWPVMAAPSSRLPRLRQSRNAHVTNRPTDTSWLVDCVVKPRSQSPRIESPRNISMA